MSPSAATRLVRGFRGLLVRLVRVDIRACTAPSDRLSPSPFGPSECGTTQCWALLPRRSDPARVSALAITASSNPALWAPLAALGLLIILLYAAPVYAQGEREIRDPIWLHLGIACSITADVLDTAATTYALRSDPDLVEANFLIGPEARDLKKLIPIKIAGAAAVNVPAVLLHSRYPIWSGVLTYGNCLGKTLVAIHNFRLGRERRAALRLALTVGW